MAWGRFCRRPSEKIRLNTFGRHLRGRVLFALNPRYEHRETWVWITDLLESETKPVALDAEWENAIEAAQTQPPTD